MNKLVIASVLVGALGLTACTTPKTETVYMYTPRPPVIEPQTQPVRMRGVEWQVITRVELEQILADLEQNPDPEFALFALTPEGFEALNTNLVEINRFMREQNQVINYYRAYIRETNNKTVPTPTARPTT